MTGHVRQRSKGSWQLIVELPKTPDGKRRQHIETYRGNKREADKRLQELLHSLNTGTYVEEAKLTVDEFFRRWLEEHRGQLSPTGYERYEQVVRLHLLPPLAGRKLSSLRPLDLQAVYRRMADRGLS